MSSESLTRLYARPGFLLRRAHQISASVFEDECRSVGLTPAQFGGQNGYGNVVEIRHSSQRSTLYAHMSRIDVTRGQHVDQGANIGTVGSTGWATGPHLHFELKVNGEQQDPMLMAKDMESPSLTAATKGQFAQLASSLRAQLEAANSTGHSGAYAE